MSTEYIRMKSDAVMQELGSKNKLQKELLPIGDSWWA
jgi:hypothetical protein